MPEQERSTKMANLLDDCLIDALENGVPTGEFDKKGKELFRKAGPSEWKIAKDRLRDMGIGEPPTGMPGLNPGERLTLAGIRGTPLSMEEDPATA